MFDKIQIQIVVVAGGDDRAGLWLDGAIVNPAEVKAYWEATLPNTPMPQAILDILEQLQGEEQKHIYSHEHGRVHFPKGARDLFFFENNITPGSVLITRILSTRSSPVFLHRDNTKHIQFSTKNFTDIINLFEPASLTMVDDIKSTLQLCEHPQMVHGEKPGCATSIESFLELVVSSLGTNDVRALSPRIPMEGVPSIRYIVASAMSVTNS
uniref:BURP domain-containing protein n=1 Tax=Leersia perrieri TaxID=77586 RepID=A0A0D9WNS7_9ORYZ